MILMKLKVIVNFLDIKENIIRNVNDVFYASKKRAKELLELGYVDLIVEKEIAVPKSNKNKRNAKI